MSETRNRRITEEQERVRPCNKTLARNNFFIPTHTHVI